MAIFAAFTGFYFGFGNLSSAYPMSDLSSLFQFIMIIILAIYAPILTMRLFSDEKKQKTDQLLLTAPVKPLGIVLGKYLSALSFFTLSLSITIIYGFVTSIFGKPVWAIFCGNFFAAFLIGAALIAIGMFMSSLTESQMVAAFLTFGTIVLLFLFQQAASAVTNPILLKIFTALSIYSHAFEFLSGIFDFSAIIYYLSVVAIFVFLTVRIIEKKRWA